LSEPTVDAAGHDLLALARHHAALLSGADPTGKAPVHCFRWPGSLHMKDPAHPVLCTIERDNAAAEVNLVDAADKLAEAVEAHGLVVQGNGAQARMPLPGLKRVTETVARIANDDSAYANAEESYDRWLVVAYAIYGATGGAGFDIFETWSAKSARHDPKENALLWDRIRNAGNVRAGFATLKRLAGPALQAQKSVPANQPTPAQVNVGTGNGAGTGNGQGAPLPGPAPQPQPGQGGQQPPGGGPGAGPGPQQGPGPGQRPRARQRPRNRPAEPTLLQMVRAIEADALWGTAVRFNEFLETVEIEVDLPKPLIGKWRELTDPLILEATAHWQGEGFTKVADSVVTKALEVVGHRHPHHPVRQYLDGLNKWNGTKRVHTLFGTYFRAQMPKDPKERKQYAEYLVNISTCFMVGAVARIYKPGCKHDHVPIVVNLRQGLLKSTAIRALCPDPTWFCEDIDPNVVDKDTKESLRGKWIIELAEMPHISKDVARVKGFVSRMTDRYRASYGKRNQDHDRQCAFFGSCNYLQFYDTSGNRRFWPFRGGLADVAAIERDRDQLWAEAVYLYKNNTKWHLSDAVEAIAREKQADFLETDVWDELISNWIGRNDALIKANDGAFLMSHLFAAGKDGFLGGKRTPADATKQDQMRAAEALHRLEYEQKRETIPNVGRGYWWRPIKP
jgi:hypothetical protein